MTYENVIPIAREPVMPDSVHQRPVLCAYAQNIIKMQRNA
jgi:hypothetical protein